MTHRAEDAFQTQSSLGRMLTQAGLSPRKRFGQHFLIDRNLMMKLVEAAEVGTDDCVLEVGAGTGCLTALLAGLAGRVVAIEIDERLADLAQRQVERCKNVEVLVADALKKKSAVAESVITAVRRAQRQAKGRLMLVANLPYDIATPLVMNLLLGDLPVERLCFTVQREVAGRFLAEADTSDYGPIGIISQAMSAPRRVCRVPASAFWPRPKVESAMLRLDVYPPEQRLVANPRAFSQFVHGFFLHRRKTMRHLASDANNAAEVLATMEKLGIPFKARPEQLSVSQWIRLHSVMQ